MASNPTTCEEIISSRRTPIRRSLTLNLSFRRSGHQVWRLESRAQPRVPLRVVDVHARRYLIIRRSQRRSYLWLWHKCYGLTIRMLSGFRLHYGPVTDRVKTYAFRYPGRRVHLAMSRRHLPRQKGMPS